MCVWRGRAHPQALPCILPALRVSRLDGRDRSGGRTLSACSTASPQPDTQQTLRKSCRINEWLRMHRWVEGGEKNPSRTCIELLCSRPGAWLCMSELTCLTLTLEGSYSDAVLQVRTLGVSLKSWSASGRSHSQEVKLDSLPGLSALHTPTPHCGVAQGLAFLFIKITRVSVTGGPR